MLYLSSEQMQEFKKKFIVSLFLLLPLVILSTEVQDLFHYELYFRGKKYVELILASILYFYVATPFLKNCFTEIKMRVPGKMTLISFALSSIYLYSGALVFGFYGGLGLDNGNRNLFYLFALILSITLFTYWLVNFISLDAPHFTQTYTDPHMEERMDRASQTVTYITLVLAILTLLIWRLLSRDWTFAVLFMSNVLLISSPDSFKLVPTLVPTKRQMRQNLIWAILYNVILIPQAIGLFFPIVMHPIFTVMIAFFNTIRIHGRYLFYPKNTVNS